MEILHEPTVERKSGPQTLVFKWKKHKRKGGCGACGDDMTWATKTICKRTRRSSLKMPELQYTRVQKGLRGKGFTTRVSCGVLLDLFSHYTHCHIIMGYGHGLRLRKRWGSGTCCMLISQLVWNHLKDKRALFSSSSHHRIIPHSSFHGIMCLCLPLPRTEHLLCHQKGTISRRRGRWKRGHQLPVHKGRNFYR